MSQSKLASFVEAVANTLIGMLIALPAQTLYLWAADVTISAKQNVGLFAFMTVVSLARSFGLRRWFNARLHLFIKESFDESSARD